MAKPLRNPVPTSSIARLFDAGAANRAVSVPEPVSIQPTPMPGPLTSEKEQAGRTAVPRHDDAAPQIKREFIFSTSADATFTDIVDLFRRCTGTRLSNSHLARALCLGLARCLPSIEREARRTGRLKLPSNAKGREGERELFESQIAAALINGIRAAAAYEWHELGDTAHGNGDRP